MSSLGWCSLFGFGLAALLLSPWFLLGIAFLIAILLLGEFFE